MYAEGIKSGSVERLISCYQVQAQASACGRYIIRGWQVDIFRMGTSRRLRQDREGLPGLYKNIKYFAPMKFPFDQEIVLENHVALLRPLQLKDMSYLLPVATSDDKLVQYSPGQIHTEELLTTYIQKSIYARQQKTSYPFIIFDKTKHLYAGSTSFLAISDIDSRLEIGATWIGHDFQRTGLNRNCKFLLLQFAFDELGAMRVELKTDERNKQSRTAIEKIGAKQEGIFRSHTLMADGHRRNTVYYSILKDEWDRMKNDFLR